MVGSGLKRKVCYVTGTRADFGLLTHTLTAIAGSPMLDLFLCVTGMHLSDLYGRTVHEIEASGLRIAGLIPVDVETASGASMAMGIGQQIIGMTDLFVNERPDIVMLLGDRGEMLAGAIAALHLNTVIVHLHGGERSGTVDEPIRHAVSKLAHYHFVATNGARKRLLRMGENAERIFVTGAPSLDTLSSDQPYSRQDLCNAVGLDSGGRIALMMYHPVVQEQAELDLQVRSVLLALERTGFQTLALTPNSDAGGWLIRKILKHREGREGLVVRTHLERPEFLSWMSAVDIMIGNSSSGIIEAASFDTPVVNVGSRQDGRERSGNVVDVVAEEDEIVRGIDTAMAMKGEKWENIYGDGHATPRIVELLETLPLSGEVLLKSNAY